MAERKWKAHWISLGQHPRDDLGVFWFRKTFEKPLLIEGEGALVKVSADQRYRLYCNGRFVGEGPQRGDLQHWFYETHDLTDHLVEGGNLLEALVWNFGHYAPMAQITYRTAFILEGAGLDTPQGWEVARDTSRDFEMMHSQVGPFYIDVGPGEIVGPCEPLIWGEPNFVVHALERGEFAGDSPWFLVPRSIPAMRRDPFEGRPLVVNRETNERQEFESLTLKPGEMVLVDFGELVCAYPQFDFEGSGATVTVTYGEGLFDKDGRKGNRSDVRGKELWGYQDKFVLGTSPPPASSSSTGHKASPADEEGAMSTLWWRTWRYLQLETDRPVQLRRCSALRTGYPYEVESSFTGDDPWIEKIWDVGIRTAKLCAGETYFDCPYYEQLQYVGDTRIQTLVHYYLSRDRRLARNAVEQFGWSIMPNGLTQSRYPTRIQQVIPPFSMFWLLMVADQQSYDASDPFRLSVASQTNLALNFWSALGPDFWPFSDWVEDWPMGIAPGGRNSTLIFLLSELASSTLHADLQGVGSSKDLTRSLEFVDGLVRHTGDLEWEPSEHAEAVYRLCQMAHNIVPDPWPTEALAKANAAQCTYYFQYYKHLAMQPDDYMAELEPWKEMVRNGLTTFAEAPEPTRSDCHAWSAHPILGFFQLIAGVTSVAPAWKKARIAPKPGKLKEFDAKIAHPDGELTIRWRDGMLEVDSPVPFEFCWQGKMADFPAGRHRF